MNPKVDFYFEKTKKWQAELEQLRRIVLECGLNEELKWGVPCYTLEYFDGGKQKNNIVLMHVFKKYCALLFFKGAIMNDPGGILVQQTEHVQASRQTRFTNVKEIIRLEPALKAYIYEAIELEKEGLKVPLKKTKEFDVPDEFHKKLEENPELKIAFEELTPGRQRGYLLHFSRAKQSKTRVSRIEKAMPKIYQGKGLNDR